MVDRPRTSLWRKSIGCGGCLGVITLSFVALIVVIGPGGDRDDPPTRPAAPIPPGPSAPPAPAPASSVGVGEGGILERPGAVGVWMTDSLESHRALVEAERKIKAGDRDVQVKGKMSRVALGLARKIKMVRNGTRVRLRGENSGALYVEALDGEDKGLSGWVPAEFFKPARRER